MAILVHSVQTSLDEPQQEAVQKAAKLLGIAPGRLASGKITKTSLDARRKGRPHFVHSVSLSLKDGETAEKKMAAASGGRAVFSGEAPLQVALGEKPMLSRPVIAGFGPAGMFAGLLLAQHGYRPMIFERGSRMEKRVAAVEGFWRQGTLDSRANVQFGEGGAGTFSDGKLTTRIGDPKCSWVLKELHRLGAPDEILYQAKPHIGTDLLRDVVQNIRREIIRLGGEVCFETAVTGLSVKNGALSGVKTENGDVAAENLILAVGHSARDTFAMLLGAGLEMQPKPFSVGVRIEHLQEQINRGLYGELAGHPALPAGEYQLSKRLSERGVYTFCMCPGGLVVPSASEDGGVVTNGMSYHARDGKNANAAVAVSVTPDDFGRHPLDGVAFQRQLEQAAFRLGGGGYRAPAQDVGSFLKGECGLRIGRVEPTYALGVEPCDFAALFPAFIADMLRYGLQDFDRKLPGYAAADAVLTGVETRTSSPVRILRGDDLQSTMVKGVYPCAEGAGYAGGIMSAAVDGMRVAMALMGRYAPADR